MNRTRVHVFPEEATEVVQKPEENDANRRSRAATSESSPFASLVWLDAGRRLCRSTTWITALKIQTLVVRNAAVSIASAWISTALCALGDVFGQMVHGSVPKRAHRIQFRVGNCSLLYYGVCIISSRGYDISVRGDATNRVELLQAPYTRELALLCRSHCRRSRI